jgi:serine/threonine protein kinase
MIGTTVSHYRIAEKLGGGGMGVVFRAEDTRLGRQVALKFLPEELVKERLSLERFLREARTASALNHPHICTIYDIGEHEGRPFIAMELLEGQTLKHRIEGRPLKADELLELAVQIAEGLEAAHAKGIVHRDIKPANLIREPNGIVKVTDFGIAKIKEGAGAPGQTVLTKSGFLLGTPHYMSPEQIREPKDAGAKCDIYSAGVVLYEMLTGTLPFNSRSLPKLIDAIYRGDKQAPSGLRPEIDKELESIVLKAMNARPEERFETARQFFEALEEYTAKQPVTGVPTARVVAATKHDEPVPAVPSSGQQQWVLVPVKNDSSEKHPIHGDSVMVGRDRTCSIVLSHPAVSRRHARITLSGSAWVLEDLQSANGTYVNNTRVDKVKLKAGDVVRFGADPACTYVLRDH